MGAAARVCGNAGGGGRVGQRPYIRETMHSLLNM